jgi:hypothetical protein
MRIMLIAAASGLSLAASTAAYADGGQGIEPNTVFTQLPGVVAQADVPNASTYAQNRQVQHQQAQNGAQSSRGAWLFPPIGKYLDQQAGG